MEKLYSKEKGKRKHMWILQFPEDLPSELATILKKIKNKSSFTMKTILFLLAPLLFYFRVLFFSSICLYKKLFLLKIVVCLLVFQPSKFN